MSRRGHVKKREVLNDYLYDSRLVSKLINQVMYDGKKALAQKIVYKAFELIEQKSESSALDVFETGVNNIMPVLEVKARRVGGANYQVPVEIRSERRVTLSIRWLVIYSRKRSERTMIERLAHEILDAANNTGGAVKKKEDTHKMAEANKAFAHYRW